MFYAMFPLARSPETTRQSYGSTAEFRFSAQDLYPTFHDCLKGYQQPPTSDDTLMMVGLELDTYGSTLSLPIVKSLEYETTKLGHPMFIERLNYHTREGWIPYRFRIITKQPQYPISGHNNSLIHLKNLSNIFRDYTGIDDVGFIDPRIDVLHTIGAYRGVFPQDILDKAQCLEASLSGHALLDTVSYDVNSVHGLQIEIDDLIREMHRTPYQQLSELVHHFVPYRYPDHLVRLLGSGGVDDIKRNRGSLKASPIDATPAPALEILYPEITFYSPVHAQEAGCWMNQTTGTDCHIVYQCQDDRVINKHVYYFCDRYCTIIDNETYHHDFGQHLNAVACLINSTKRYFAETQGSINGWSVFPRETFVTVVKTFGEEVLMSISHQVDAPPFYVVHLDLAILSLCSMGTLALCDVRPHVFPVHPAFPQDI